MLNQLPFVKLLIPFIIGIVVAIQWPVSLPCFNIFLTISLSLSALTFLKRQNELVDAFLNLGFILLLFSLGGWTVCRHSLKYQNSSLKTIGTEGLYYISISDLPQEKPKSFKLNAVILQKLGNNGSSINLNEKALIYFDRRLPLPKPGDRLIIKCRFTAIPPPENPYQFNYKGFLQQQGIFYQAFVRNTSLIVRTKVREIPLIYELSNKGVCYLKKLFSEHIRDSVAAGVTESLLFGYKDDLPKELVESYARTGTLHVLAVSGMHVAIVFLLFAKLLWFLDKLRYGKWIKTIIILTAIWGYCILTGLAPSIIRAGLMISLVLIGKAINRRALIYNLIAASAFFILLLNPYSILNVGFQLSYAAVLGIVYLQPLIMGDWRPSNLLLRQMVDILVMSLAAQMATFPVSLYYFHQFPNYFLLSNLIIIPLTTLVIYFGIGMVLFAKIPFMLILFSWLTEKTVLLTNTAVRLIENLPFSFTDGVQINLIQLISVYACVFCLIRWLTSSHTNFLLSTLIFCALISGIYAYDKIQLQKQKSIVFFNIPGQNAILISDGRRAVLLYDGKPSGKMMFYIRGWLIHQRLWPLIKIYDYNLLRHNRIQRETMDLSIKKGFLFFKNVRLCLFACPTMLSNVNYTYLIPHLTEISDNSNWGTLIIGHTISRRYEGIFFQKFDKYPDNRKYYLSLSGIKVLKIN